MFVAALGSLGLRYILFGSVYDPLYRVSCGWSYHNSARFPNCEDNR